MRDEPEVNSNVCEGDTVKTSDKTVISGIYHQEVIMDSDVEEQNVVLYFQTMAESEGERAILRTEWLLDNSLKKCHQKTKLLRSYVSKSSGKVIGFCWKDSLLVRKQEGTKMKQLVVPLSSRACMLRLPHDPLTAGYLGTSKTYS